MVNFDVVNKNKCIYHFEFINVHLTSELGLKMERCIISVLVFYFWAISTFSNSAVGNFSEKYNLFSDRYKLLMPK